MAVHELTLSLRNPFLSFVRIYDYKSISFISRIYQNGQLIIPSAKIAKIFCEVSETNPENIKNAIMITSGGIIMPIFSDKYPSPEVIKIMLKNILKYKNKIFCILGIKEDTELIKKELIYSSSSTINYSLLRDNTYKQFTHHIRSLSVKKAKKRDALLLFQLEKAYLQEEVLVGNNSINQQAILHNLRKTCSNQSVFFASVRKEIIAKVNTNGKGFGYNQIGGVYTKPQYRNQGISTYLMKYLLNEIHKSGKNAVLYVKKENDPALSLYKKLGFQIIGNYSAHYISN
ncbi:MAG: GNAT family N-acetyltransferase [Spirochaetia bacterium]|nr:GNAT family N-acetyltransferase [Spirochaetia bacterium]